jgi:Icc-related predicted phosphoesterase
MKVVMISDTHDRHLALNGFLPEGDVLVHAGDLTMDGTLSYVQKSLNWLNDLPYAHVVFVAGNHDFAFEDKAKKDRLDFGRLIYLEDSGVEIEGKKFWGSPIQPWFFDWAFNRRRGDDISKHWKMIPAGLDVLMTHGPPMYILDQTPRYHENVGCYDLAEAVKIAKPKVHVFGHIHNGYGHQVLDDTKFFNASICTEMYEPKNLPFVVEI